jgi:hypothetical protein
MHTKHGLAALLVLAVLIPSAPAVGAHGDKGVGFNTHLAPDDIYEAVNYTGAKWVRIDVNWSDIETGQGRFNWGGVDRVVNKARSLGLNIFATFAYTPQWASSGNADGQSFGNDVPRPGFYERALREAVRRYRGKVFHWGLWNEANLDGFWEGSPQQYVDLIVRPGADAVHAECPECLTLGPELANVGDELNDYYDTVLGQAGSKFDIITHHIYQTFYELDLGAGVFGDSFFNALESKRVTSSRKSLLEALKEHNLDGKDVWITETGHQCEGPTDSGEMDNQKKYYELVLRAEHDRDWWTNTFFYEIYDCGTEIPNCSIDGYGVLRRISGPDGTWGDNFLVKPAFNAVANWIIEHPAFAGGQDDDDDDGGGCSACNVRLGY